MSPFNFQPVQLLELSDSDCPTLDVQADKIVLTAQRGEEKIRITAPLRQIVPQVAATTLKVPQRTRQETFVAAGKKRQGVNNGMAKLDEQSVREIRLMVTDSKFVESFGSRQALYQELGRAYNVHPATIKNVVENVSWKNITI